MTGESVHWGTPYYEDNRVAIFHGDCREILPAMRHIPASAVITDPPYGETSLLWDRWPDGWLDVVGAAVPESAPLWCFGSMRMFLERANDFADWKLSQDIVWEKHNGSGFHADRFKRVHEHALQWYRGQWSEVYAQPVYTSDATARAVRRKERPPHMGEIEGSTYKSVDGGPRLARSVQMVRSCHGSAVHPTQKPEGILAPLVEYSVPLGGLVLDPFMGSGSTLLTAVNMGRQAIGIEVHERYCETAAERLSEPRLDLAPVAYSGGSVRSEHMETDRTS